MCVWFIVQVAHEREGLDQIHVATAPHATLLVISSFGEPPFNKLCDDFYIKAASRVRRDCRRFKVLQRACRG